ncbi:MAG: MarR family transcriptional regulator [Pseudorhodobacter sp.]
MTLDTYLPYKLATTAESFSRKLVEVYGHAHGLSREEWRLLFLLADVEELTSLDLTQRTTLDKVQVSRAAQKLEDKGLISRSIPESDRRLRVYTCSKKGQDLFAEIFPKVEARAEAILSKISPQDRETLWRSIDILAKAVAAHSQDQKTSVA